MMRKRKAKRKENKERKKEFVERREKGKERRKGKGREKEKGRISKRSDGLSSTVQVLKLVHSTRSTCGHQKLGVSTNSMR